MKVTEAQTLELKKGVADYVDARFREQLAIHDIIVAPRKDRDGDGYFDIRIVYEGDLRNIDLNRRYWMHGHVNLLIWAMDLPHYHVHEFVARSELR